MKAKYQEEFPDDPGMNSFENWQQFEKNYTGSGQLLLFWLQKPTESIESHS
jgi:hypothetical protein